MELVRYDLDGAVARITLDRPPVNALNTQLIGEVAEAIDRAADATIRAVVVTGAKHFAAGADIGRFADSFDRDEEPQASRLAETASALEQLNKPTIAAISGFALGGGLELAMGADFRYLDAEAKVGQPEIKLGLIPGAGGTQRLTRLVGFQRAKELVMSGRHVGAEEALAIGLADKVLAPGELLEGAMVDAAAWARGPTLAYAAAKQALANTRGESLESGIAAEQRLFVGLFQTADARAGVEAFMNKETPEFAGS